MVYRRVPSSWIRRSLFGIVILWATDFFPLWKNVSGVQILLAIKLFNLRMFIGPLNFNLSSFHLWRKKTSIVYSCNGIKICFLTQWKMYLLFEDQNRKAVVAIFLWQDCFNYHVKLYNTENNKQELKVLLVWHSPSQLLNVVCMSNPSSI